MIDVESLGLQPSSVILEIAFCLFDKSGPIETICKKLDIKQQMNRFGRTVCPSNLKWWAAQERKMPVDGDYDFYTALELIYEASEECATIWSRGTFDMDLIGHAWKELGFYELHGEFCEYFKWRDQRTVVPIMGRKSTHDAAKDCEDQVFELIESGYDLDAGVRE